MNNVKLVFHTSCVVGHGYPDAFPGAVVNLPANVAAYFVSRGLATVAPAAPAVTEAPKVENKAVKPKVRRG
jgi:hypothetical protein